MKNQLENRLTPLTIVKNVGSVRQQNKVGLWMHTKVGSLGWLSPLTFMKNVRSVRQQNKVGLRVHTKVGSIGWLTPLTTVPSQHCTMALVLHVIIVSRGRNSWSWFSVILRMEGRLCGFLEPSLDTLVSVLWTWKCSNIVVGAYVCKWRLKSSVTLLRTARTFGGF